MLPKELRPVEIMVHHIQCVDVSEAVDIMCIRDMNICDMNICDMSKCAPHIFL